MRIKALFIYIKLIDATKSLENPIILIISDLSLILFTLPAFIMLGFLPSKVEIYYLFFSFRLNLYLSLRN